VFPRISSKLSGFHFRYYLVKYRANFRVTIHQWSQEVFSHPQNQFSMLPVSVTLLCWAGEGTSPWNRRWSICFGEKVTGFVSVRNEGPQDSGIVVFFLSFVIWLFHWRPFLTRNCFYFCLGITCLPGSSDFGYFVICVKLYYCSKYQLSFPKIPLWYLSCWRVTYPLSL
jgi:hypothetical protein